MEAELEPVIDFSRLEYVFVIEATALEAATVLEEPVPDTAGEGPGND
jgi:hypothetical protein